MKQAFWTVAFLLSLVFVGQARTVLCQDEVTARQGERILNLQIGLQNTGWISYNAYAETSGDTKDWVTPTYVSFGSIQPGETKTATYTLMVPRDASPGAYVLYWKFYGYSGSYTKYLFMQTLIIKVVPAGNPLSLLPLWVLVCIGIVVPLWYWTRKKTAQREVLPEIVAKAQLGLRRVALYFLVTGILFSGVFYATSRIPIMPVGMFEYRTDTTTLTQSMIVTTDTRWVESIATTITSTTTHRDEEFVVLRTIQSTTTRSSQIQVTIWSTETATSTHSYEVTQYQSFSQRHPTLWLVTILLFVLFSTILIAKICIR